MIDDGTPNGWLLGPPGNCVQFLSNGLAAMTLVEQGIATLAGFPTYLNAAIPTIRRNAPALIPTVGRLVQYAHDNARFAESYADGSSAALRNLTCVAQWSALETTIEEMLVNHVVKVADALQRIEAAFPATSKDSKFDAADTERVRYFVRRWESRTGLPGVLERANAMLSVFHLGFEIPDETHHLLTELAEFRNLCLHRGNVIDATFLKKVAWTNRSLGERYDIDKASLMKFFDASSKLAIQLLGKAAKSPWIYIDPNSKSD